MRGPAAAAGVTMAIAAAMVVPFRMPVAGAQASPPVSLDVLLARAGSYVARFGSVFRSVVAEEQYVQQVEGRQRVSGTGRGASVSMDSERRELVSDFLLVKVAAGDSWAPFRDVFRVDGRPVREREDRLAKLILQPSAAGVDQVQAIARESARYNIGDVERTINMPLLAFSFLEKQHQWRFRFSHHEEREIDQGVSIVSYDEQARPTFVQTPDGRPLYATGRIWLHADTGRIQKTELLFQDSILRTRITVSFKPDPRFDLDIPDEMNEEYVLLKSRVRVTGRASYSRFRRFDVTSSEIIDTPEPPPTPETPQTPETK